MIHVDTQVFTYDMVLEEAKLEIEGPRSWLSRTDNMCVMCVCANVMRVAFLVFESCKISFSLENTVHKWRS